MSSDAKYVWFYPPKVDDSLQLFLLKQLRPTSSWCSALPTFFELELELIQFGTWRHTGKFGTRKSGYFQVKVYDEGDGREGRKNGPTPTKSTILNNFVNLRTPQKLCPGALPAFFGAYGDTPDMETHRFPPGTSYLVVFSVGIPSTFCRMLILRFREKQD